MPIPRLPQNDREITYKVGWKKGTMHKKADDIGAVPIVSKDKGIAAYVWYKAPMLPAFVDLYILCALPIISILSISALIYFLNQS